MRFYSKARTLEALQGKLTHAKVLPLVITSMRELSSSPEAVFTRIANLNAPSMIIRSSSQSEDSEHASNAGAFLSLANIAHDKNALYEAMHKVASSMPSIDDEILIQPMLNHIALCGVGFSVDVDSNAPYFCISFDSSGDNASVTSGSSNAIASFTLYRGDSTNVAAKINSAQEQHSALNIKQHSAQEQKLPARLDAPHARHILETLLYRVIAMICELEKLFSCTHLDVEFAITTNSLSSTSTLENAYLLYLLQARPLVMTHKDLAPSLPSRALERLTKRINALSAPHPNVLGEKAIFGVMPDWNPAEIIGLKPKRLALSLYKEIITDSVWAYQRDNYGYRNLRSHPLMHSFLGIPYIDVRLSFNSFIPKSLDTSIATKLVNYYIHSLESAPQSHDKIEFDIVFSCYCFSTPTKLQGLLAHGFNHNEIKRIEFALLDLTNSILAPNAGLYIKDLEKSKQLEERYLRIVNSSLSIYDKIYWLIEDCKRYGTLPFAGVARAAFIAMQILHSLVEIGFFTTAEKEAFLASLHTISKQLAYDKKHLNKEAFLARYGHLRAGSYDICSPRYDEDMAYYFSSSDTEDIPSYEASSASNCHCDLSQDDSIHSPFMLDASRLSALDVLLKEHGLGINGRELLLFLQQAIQGRESVKFAFSKLLSQALTYIKQLGESLHISVSDMAHLDCKSILGLYASLYKDAPKERFLQEIAHNKQEFAITRALKLPPLITSSSDVFSFFSFSIAPNFITTKRIVGDVAVIDSTIKSHLATKIALITSADPGYDYLFTQGIAGFITCYGGSNSHMAIRASELGMPAAIGVGEQAFFTYTKAKRLQLDCQAQQILCL